MSANNQNRPYHTRPNIRRPIFVLSLLLLALIFGAIFVAQLWSQKPIQAHAAKVVASPTANTPTGLLRFNDTNHNLSLIIQTNRNDVNYGVFTFVTSQGGAQYHGGKASDLRASDRGERLTLNYEGSVQFIRVSADGLTTKSTKVNVTISATIDLKAMSAEAILTDVKNKKHFVMETRVPTNQTQVVKTHNQAVVKQDWATVYTNTSQMALGGLTEAQFAQLVTQQEQTSGVITAIVMTSTPQIGTNPAGITYFTVVEQVTITLNGVEQTQSLTSVFVLEKGRWKFWFSSAG